MQGELKRRKAAQTVAYINDFIADRESRRAAARAAEWREDRKIQACPCFLLCMQCSMVNDPEPGPLHLASTLSTQTSNDESEASRRWRCGLSWTIAAL